MDDAYRTTYDDDPAPATRAAGRTRDPRFVVDGHVPGEVGIWVFVLGDMFAFALFFGVFLVARGEDPVAFDEARRSLGVGFAVANTLLLLTSSWFVATAVRAVRAGQRRHAPRLIVLAALCGVGFVANKAVEYGEKLSAGIDAGTNDFFMYFFMLTGIHLLHVLIGLVVLGLLWRAVRRAEAGPDELRIVESGASYWHMVDLLWIVLFPLLYLVS